MLLPLALVALVESVLAKVYLETQAPYNHSLP
jgi:hypothetical protein